MFKNSREGIWWDELAWRKSKKVEKQWGNIEKINFCGFCVLRCFNVALFSPRFWLSTWKQKHQIKSRAIKAKGKTTKFFGAVKLKNIKFNKNKATAANIISVVPKLTQNKNFALNSLRWRNLVFCVTFLAAMTSELVGDVCGAWGEKFENVSHNLLS